MSLISKKKLHNMSDKQSTELIIYQLGEVKNLLENMSIKFDSYKEITDNRIKSLELKQAAQDVIDSNIPKTVIDWQKIILAAFALISTVVALAFGFNHPPLPK